MKDNASLRDYIVRRPMSKEQVSRIDRNAKCLNLKRAAYIRLAVDLAESGKNLISLFWTNEEDVVFSIMNNAGYGISLGNCPTYYGSKLSVAFIL